MAQPPELDAPDRKILRALARDGRLAWRDLALEIGLSLTPTLRRVRRLEADGYIQGYAAKLNQARLRGGMTAFISVTLEKQVDDALQGFENRVANLAEVTSAFLMTGGADYLLQAIVRDLDHYQILLMELTRIPGVAHIQSSFALKTIAGRNLPFP